MVRTLVSSNLMNTKRHAKLMSHAMSEDITEFIVLLLSGTIFAHTLKKSGSLAFLKCIILHDYELLCNSKVCQSYEPELLDHEDRGIITVITWRLIV